MPPNPTTEESGPSSASVSQRLNPELAEAFAPIPHALIFHASDLVLEMKTDGVVVEKKKLRPLHFAVLCYLLGSKWGEKNPWPSATTIRDRLGVSYNAVLGALDDLERAQSWSSGNASSPTTAATQGRLGMSTISLA